MVKNNKKLDNTELIIAIDSLALPNMNNWKEPNKTSRKISTASMINQHLIKLDFLCEIPYNNAQLAMNFKAKIMLNARIIHFSELMTKSNWTHQISSIIHLISPITKRIYYYGEHFQVLFHLFLDMYISFVIFDILNFHEWLSSASY